MTSLELVIKRLKADYNYMKDRLVKGNAEHGEKNINSSLISQAHELHQEVIDVTFYVRELMHLASPDIHEPRRIFIAGPYNGKTSIDTWDNIDTAKDVHATLIEAGHFPFCPHSHTAGFGERYPWIKEASYYKLCEHWLRLCNGIYMLPNWETSIGACNELSLAREKYEIPVYFSMNEVPYVQGKQHPKLIWEDRRYEV